MSDAMVAAAMAHLDQRAEGGRCAEMVAEMIAAALAAQWQPIETAPKDGTDILVFSPRGVEPRVFGVCWCDYGDPEESGWWDSHNLTGREVDCELTHWMPLPEPPS